MPIELDTPDELHYVFHSINGNVVNFKVRAPNDAHLALTTGQEESNPMIEVFIGGWSNQKSVIRKNQTKPDVAEAETPDILSPGEFRGFWIRWFDGVITVGREGEVAAFLSYEDPESFPINYVGVCTGWGASGSWIIEESSCNTANATPSAPSANIGGWATPAVGSGVGCWVPAKNGEVPPDAMEAGFDGEQLYIARAQHEGALIPGKLVPSHCVCYVPWGGVENPHEEYEVLCAGSGQWIKCSGSDIPGQAVPAGETEEGEPLFIGRAEHEGTITVGKVQPSHGVCYIPYGGQELSYPEYEILISN